jgi:hypothetical protein
VADLTAIRNALAAQITAHTGLRCDGQARDQVTPPCAVVLPAPTFVTYGATMDEAMTLGLVVLLIITDAAPVEMTQRALDAYLGMSHGEDIAGSTQSVPAAILDDPTLGGTAEYCEPVSVSNYGRIEYAGVPYFGARLNLTAGAI